MRKGDVQLQRLPGVQQNKRFTASGNGGYRNKSSRQSQRNGKRDGVEPSSGIKAYDT